MKCGGILGSVRAQQDEDMELSVSAVAVQEHVDWIVPTNMASNR